MQCVAFQYKQNKVMRMPLKIRMKLTHSRYEAIQICCQTLTTAYRRKNRSLIKKERE